MNKLGKIVKRNGKYYKLVAPDGGWAFLIALGTVVAMLAMWLPFGCYAILFADFFETYHISASNAALQNGLSIFFFSCSGLVTSTLLKRYTLRQVGLLGSALFNAGTFMTATMTTFAEFLVGNAIVAGLGAGMMLNVSMTAFNMYFDKKKAFYMNLTQAAISIVVIVCPILIELTIREYGWRGTLIFCVGFGLQTVVLYSLYHPVEQHLKLEEIPETTCLELTPLNGQEVKATTTSEKRTVIPEIVLNGKRQNKSTIKNIAKLLDLQLLKDCRFLVSCVGISSGLICDVFLLSLFPLYLGEQQWSKRNITFFMTLVLTGDMAARTFNTVLSRFCDLNPTYMFLGGAALTVAIRSGLFVTTDVTTLYAVATALGLARSVIQVCPTLIVSTLVAPQKFPAAQALQQLMIGLLMPVIGPAIGALKDWSGGYELPFHVMTAVYSLCLLLWTAMLLRPAPPSMRPVETDAEPIFQK